jgi:hypothetical protein
MRIGSFFLLCLAVPAFGTDVISPDKAKADPKSDILWYNVGDIGMEGQGWTDTKAPFDRLPGKADGFVRAPVWNLSRHSTGLVVRFTTDATAIHARWTLTSPSLAMPHMPATGVSGLDLYVKTTDGKWRWLANGRPTAQTNTAALAQGLPEGKRDYLLYLPLYNGVSSVDIGIAKGKSLEKSASRPAGRRKPIVFYGTSITQGGCASRPGMVHTAILGRQLDYPVINLGFSGNGKMEPEVAKLLAELDPACYVIDCLPNMNGEEVGERVGPLVETLRKAHPTTPILLVEDRTFTNAFLLPARQKHHETSRAALKKAFDRLTPSDKNLYYLKGDDLLGDDGEGTVDSSHPTDLGFVRQAAAFRPVLERILK